MEIIIKYIIFFIGTLSFSVLINGIFLKFVRTLGIRNPNEAVIRWSSQVKPALGGISFFIIFLLSITLYPYLFSNFQGIDRSFTGIIIATTVGFLMGLADDAYNTRPLLKLLTQFSCSLILIYTNNYINLFESNYLNYGLTIVWVIGLMNSINMLDNMDGITTTVSICITIAFLVILVINKDPNDINVTVVIGLLASLLGFLYFNWNPSKMFMGDTGSQYLGVLLAALSINILWNPSPSPSPDEVSISRQFLIPLITFIIPIVDTTTVVINRLSKGNSPFIGGKDHTTHHLSYAGLSDRMVAIVIGSISLISSLIAT